MYLRRQQKHLIKHDVFTLWKSVDSVSPIRYDLVSETKTAPAAGPDSVIAYAASGYNVNTIKEDCESISTNTDVSQSSLSSHIILIPLGSSFYSSGAQDLMLAMEPPMSQSWVLMQMASIR